MYRGEGSKSRAEIGKRANADMSVGVETVHSDTSNDKRKSRSDGNRLPMRIRLPYHDCSA